MGESVLTSALLQGWVSGSCSDPRHEGSYLLQNDTGFETRRLDPAEVQGIGAADGLEEDEEGMNLCMLLLLTVLFAVPRGSKYPNSNSSGEAE